MNLYIIHSTTAMGSTENQLTVEARALKEKASQIFESVYSQPGIMELVKLTLGLKKN